jgi:hypothetical protein
MKFKDISNHSALIEFNQLMESLKNETRPNYSCVGFNYKGEEISSVKFYYVFFNHLSIPFVIPELKETYVQHIKDVSEKHLSTPLLPGAGLTFTIKFDAQMNITKGVFFRVDRNNQSLKDNFIHIFSEYDFDNSDFCDGYGQYLLFKNGKISTSEYLYLHNFQKIEQLGKEFGIRFSDSDMVEISSSGTSDRKNIKFIAIGGSQLIDDCFYNRIPQKIRNLFNSDNLQYCCPAINSIDQTLSVYVYGKKILERDSINPIEYFFKKQDL